MRRRIDLAKDDGVTDNAYGLSIRKRAHLLGVNRSSLYVPVKSVDRHMSTLMNEISDIYSRRPFQGYKRITDDLKEMGYQVNHKRIYRLMKEMGLQAIYPKKNVSKRNHKEGVFPYLLKDQSPTKPHDCWSVDITYIKIATGYVYLTALIDVVSRCVMGWCVSTQLDTESCLQALRMAIKTGYKPKIINSDQGCQFTSQAWMWALVDHRIDISMDGKGRWADNIYIERFWRTLKYEEVYLKTYDSVVEARACLGTYIYWYNHHRRHSSLGKQRPFQVMMNGLGEKGIGCGYVENDRSFTHIPTPTTTKTTNYLKNDGLINIKLQTGHSSTLTI